MDLNRLEQVTEEQRARIAETCRPEQGMQSSPSRCELTQLLLSHLEQHLNQQRKAKPLEPPSCRPVIGLLETLSP